ncbi:hypothetical protein MNBD_GAMMA09-3483 [hydrothermal vent metagenome]|uniref:ABC transporter domain-containing protein n=1 Tax=hydrothermal vent metagenome TaxID=652676 RepID=A0A3B0XF23_9ZZZZ
MTKLQTENLTVKIAGKTVCKNMRLDLHPGEIWGLLGRNGIGKTTLLHTLAGLRPAASGNILLNQKNLQVLSRKTIAQKLGLLLQQTEDIFPTSVMETVLSGRHPHMSHWQWESRSDYDMAQQALERVDMQAFAQRQVNQLSGGERQRVAIATLLTQNPDIFLLDEPNSHLDLKYQIQLLNTLTQKVRTENKIILMSLHDPNLALRYCDKILLLIGDGQTLSGNTEDKLNEENLMKLYDYPVIKINASGYSAFIAK